MAEELASDCGFVRKADDYISFVQCINNMLEYGCTYSGDMMESIREKCRQSRLPVARAILRECDRASQNESRIRPSHLKWWETYRKPERRVPDAPRKRRPPARQPNARRGRRNEEGRPRKRPMSPLFEKAAVPNWASRKRRRR